MGSIVSDRPKCQHTQQSPGGQLPDLGAELPSCCLAWAPCSAPLPSPPTQARTPSRLAPTDPRVSWAPERKDFGGVLS